MSFFSWTGGGGQKTGFDGCLPLFYNLVPSLELKIYRDSLPSIIFLLVLVIISDLVLLNRVRLLLSNKTVFWSSNLIVFEFLIRLPKKREKERKKWNRYIQTHTKNRTTSKDLKSIQKIRLWCWKTSKNIKSLIILFKRMF